MGVILSLQGCMGVGKTTAVQYIEAHAPDIHISREDVRPIVDEVRRRGLDKNAFEDYIEIQKLWLMNEVRRWERAQAYGVTVMDFGAEEIEFYTLHYPQTIGKQWNVEASLVSELAAVRACMPDRILFLDASEATLRRRKEGDTTRSRMFFEHHLAHLLPLKRSWFIGREDVDVLNVDELTAQETGARVLAWVREHS